MSRLASLTPSRHNSRSSPSPSPGPPSTPSRRHVQTTHHRLLKLVLKEVQGAIKTWDELMLLDGLKAGKGCIDEATEMDNILQTPETPERPPLSPHLEALHSSRAALQAVMLKCDRLLAKLALLVDQAEKLYFEAHRLQGYDFVAVEPMWFSWTMEHFVDSLNPLLSTHNRLLALLTSLAHLILSPSTPFQDARTALEQWRDLARGGERWEAVRSWEELVALEMSGGGAVDDDAEEEDEDDDMAVSVGSGGGRGKKGKKGRKG